MLVELGLYRTINDTFAHRTMLPKGHIVTVIQIIVNRNIDLCNVTIELNKSEQYRIPIDRFIKYYEKIDR